MTGESCNSREALGINCEVLSLFLPGRWYSPGSLVWSASFAYNKVRQLFKELEANEVPEPHICCKLHSARKEKYYPSPMS